MKKLITLLLLNTVLTVMLFAQDKFSKGTVLKVLEIGSSTPTTRNAPILSEKMLPQLVKSPRKAMDFIPAHWNSNPAGRFILHTSR